MIIRPYKSCIKTAEILSPEHLSHQKLVLYAYITAYFNELRYINVNGLMEYLNDDYFNFYWCDGKPAVNVLLNLYYSVHYYWLKNCGDRHDFCKGYNSIYIKHKHKFSDDPLTVEQAVIYRHWLRNYDRRHYKSKFPNLKERKDVSIFLKGEHRNCIGGK